MKERIEAILAEINGLACRTGKEIEDARVRLLGKKGEITKLFEEFRTVAPELKKEFGKSLNETVKIRNNGGNHRLLQHDFGNPHPIR